MIHRAAPQGRPAMTEALSTPGSPYPLDRSNLFARIILGELPAAKVWESDLALAFLDIHPAAPGHTLLVPKGSFASLMDLPDDLSAHLGRVLPRLCRAVKETTGADGINVIVNNGAAAGQVIFHVHYHIIPRFVQDGYRWPFAAHPYQNDAMEKMRAALADRLARETESAV